jgi:hypothetical protein
MRLFAEIAGSPRAHNPAPQNVRTIRTTKMRAGNDIGKTVAKQLQRETREGVIIKKSETGACDLKAACGAGMIIRNLSVTGTAILGVAYWYGGEGTPCA